jgi:predicted GNAT family acetyltransferase
VEEPRVLLKLCGSEDLMRQMLTPRWQIQPASFMMVRASSDVADVRLPSLYWKAPVEQNGPVIKASIYTSDGALAASGYAVETEADRVFIYDRIITEAAHRRLGLATAVMAALASRRRSKASRHVLVATPQGRCLYEKLGWEVYSPYNTASLPS